MRNKKYLDVIVIIIAVLAAWFPLLQNYTKVADDFIFSKIFNYGIYEGLLAYSKTVHNPLVVWRIFGHSVAIMSTILNPKLYGFIAIITHLITVICFLYICKFLFKSDFLAFCLSLCVGIFPWGYQALVWAPAYTYTLATALLLINLVYLHKANLHNEPQSKIFLISFIISSLCLLSNEVVIFALAGSGTWVWLKDTKLNLQTLKTRALKLYSGFAPLFVSLIYISAYKLLSLLKHQRDYELKPISYNIEAPVSVYFYQFSNFDIFQPLLNSINWKFIFYGWDIRSFILSFLLVLILGIALRILIPKLINNKVNLLSSHQMKNLLIYILLLLIGMSMIYAFSGGFSLDSRKKYPIIPVLCLLLGYIYVRFFNRKIQLPQLLIYSILSSFCIFGIVTTWMVTGIYNYEVNRYNSLADFIVAHPSVDEVQIIWNPDIYKAWPNMSRTLGFRLDDEWVLNAALLYKGGNTVKVGSNSNTKIISYNDEINKWQLK